MRRGLSERPEHSVAGPGSRARLGYDFVYTAATLKLLMGNHLATLTSRIRPTRFESRTRQASPYAETRTFSQ